MHRGAVADTPPPEGRPRGGADCRLLNPTDPWKEVDGERSNVNSRHAAFSDKVVRDAGMPVLLQRPAGEADHQAEARYHAGERVRI